MSDRESDNVSVASGSKRRCFSIRFKLDVIEHAKKGSVHSASTKYGLDRKCVKDWMAKEAQLMELK